MVLTLALVVSLAIPVAASSYSKYGTYNGSSGNCDYHAYANCTTTGWNALTEWSGSSDSYTNYTFRTDVVPYFTTAAGTQKGSLIPGSSAQLVASNVRSAYASAMHHIDTYHYVNGSLATTIISVLAN